MKRPIALSAFCMCAMLARADIYVDAAAAPSSADGTADHPYATIQDAVDNAPAGTTIRIAEGVYDKGGHEFEGYTHARVYIDGKALHLVGAGRGKTVVVGERAATADGRGTGARRCIHANWADGTIIEGVTLKGGSTVSSPDHQTHYNSQSGGGIMCEGGTSGGTTSDPLAVYVVDSEIIDCRAAFGGGAKGGTFIRCLFDSCGADQGAASDNSRLVNCVATRSCPLHTWNTDGVVYDSTIVNCTLVDNATKTAVANTSHVVNSLVTTSSSVSETSSGTTDITGSVLSSTASKGRVQLLAPAVGDWRLLNTSDAVDAANYSALESLSLPEGVDPFKDFSGKAIVGNAGQINAGAIQAVVTPAAGGLFFRYSENGVSYVVADGRTNMFDSATWVFPEVYPTQYVFAAAPSDAGKALCRVARYSGTLVNAQLGFAPRLDDTVCLLPPPTPGVVMTNYFEFANDGKVRWVDAENGSDSNSGTEALPYKTLKAAVQSIDFTTGASVVYVKKGVYGEETMDGPAAVSEGKFRLVVDAGDYGRIRIMAVDGPEETFIVGAPNTPETAGSLDGCGNTDAVRGVLLVGKSDVSLQGFTITGCYSRSDYDSRKNGAAIFSTAGAKRAQITDCIISNNYAFASIVHGGLLKRCKIIGNTSKETVLNVKDDIAVSDTSATASFCVFADNTLTEPSAGQGLIGGAARVYNCTVVGARDAGRVTGGKTGLSRNTVYWGGETVYGAPAMTNCVVWGCADASALAGTPNKVEKVRFVDLAAGDYRVGKRSPCVGYAAALDADPYFWQVYDGAMDGLLAFDANGRHVVGAYQTAVKLARDNGLTLVVR